MRNFQYCIQNGTQLYCWSPLQYCMRLGTQLHWSSPLNTFDGWLMLVWAWRGLESRLRQTAKVNLYHVTNFPLYLSFTVYYSDLHRNEQFHASFILNNCFELFLSPIFWTWEIVTWNLRLTFDVIREPDSKSIWCFTLKIGGIHLWLCDDRTDNSRLEWLSFFI